MPNRPGRSVIDLNEPKHGGITQDFICKGSNWVWEPVIVINQPSTPISQGHTVVSTVRAVSKMKSHSNKMIWYKMHFACDIQEARNRDDVRMEGDALQTLAILTINVSIKHQRYACTSLVTCSA